MESGVENSLGGGYAKKSRSLNLKSLYKSNVTNDAKEKNLKRKGVTTEDVEKKKSRKKKSRKEVSLSSLENTGERNVGEECHGGSSPSWQDTRKLKSGLIQKLNSSDVLERASLSLQADVPFPKQKRDFVGLKKNDSCQRFISPGESGGEADPVDQMTRLKRFDFVAGTGKVKEKIYLDLKEERSSAQSSKEKEGFVGHSVVKNDNGDVSVKKKHKNPKKIHSPSHINTAKEAQSLVNKVKICDGAKDDDDEQNLEENAAMMLSSRFDPSCTGFSSSGKSSALPSESGLSLLLPSGGNLVSNHTKSYRGSASALGDDANRVLRPRKQHKQKGNTRKRRHFYEIFFRNFDAYWVLNRKIKVFWPLDQIWYYGIVIDYDKERNLHHVKYDDRDEEWIDLQNERFKLLLLPTEAPGRTERKKSLKKIGNMDVQKGSRNPKKEKKKKKREFSMENDACVGSCMESEPIISWLTRSSLRVKSSPVCSVKKHKSSGSSQSSAPRSCDIVSTNGHVANHSFGADASKLVTDSGPRDCLADGAQGVNLSLQSATCPTDNKLPIVYSRMRFRKSFLQLFREAEENRVRNSIPVSVSSLAPGGVCDLMFGGPNVREIDGHSFQNDDLRSICFLNMDTKKFKFALSFPIRSVLNNSFGSEEFWLYRAVVLLHHGAMVTKWPRVCLEILIVDNVVGLRFLLIESSLKKALSFVVLILTAFHQPVEWGKHIDFQIPVTSIRFKLSCVQDLKKHLLFACYNFSKVKSSRWIWVDSKLKRYSMLTKKLAIEDCTYDNIHALQHGMNELPSSSISSEQSKSKVNLQVIQYKSRHCINVMGSPRGVSIQKDTSCSSDAEEMIINLPPFALSLSAAPAFFLNLHLRWLMEHTVAHICFHDHVFGNEKGKSGYLVMDECCNQEGSSNRESDIPENNRNHTACDGSLSPDKKEVVAGPSVFRNGNVLLQDHQDVACRVTGTSLGDCGSEIINSNWLPKCQTQLSEMGPLFFPCAPSSTGDKADRGSHTLIDCIAVEIPSLDQPEKHVVSEINDTQNSTEFSWNMNGGIVPSTNPTARRSTWQRNRSSASSVGFPPHGWTDGKADLFQNGFNYGPKKPRTQVSYSLPFGGFDFCSRHRSRQQKGLPHKQIRRGNEKRSVSVPRSTQENLESLCCDVNVLVTVGDRGWRECGAQVLLELFDHNVWKLAVKISGITKYSHKPHQFLHPGSTNRYTHALMWKGGKDWILELSGRSQWAIFKEIHDECYNRNIRAASVKNIPIPGVRLIEESDENGPDLSFFRTPKYFQQVETDIQMALDPSRVVYDMDSEDEDWILNIKNSSKDEISEEMYEKTMDVLEKTAYTRQREEFTSDEIEELFVNVFPLHFVRDVYAYWHEKRQRNGMALIRNFQPPLWEKYQKEVTRWEQASAKNNNTIVNGCLDKAKIMEKPPMFAFCLKPRGLEMPNRGSKQRSHKKVSVSGHTHTLLGDQDGFHSFGSARRLNGFAVADEKFVRSGHVYDSLDDSPLSQISPTAFSPKDVDNMNYFSLSNDGFDRNFIPKLHRRKSNKFVNYMPPGEIQMSVPYTQRSKRNGVSRWNEVYHDWSNQKPYYFKSYGRHGSEQIDGPELDEFRMRDAASAAQHALIMAKHKRQKAHRLLYRADLAIHKAVVALMTAEAIKASQNPSGNG